MKRFEKIKQGYKRKIKFLQSKVTKLNHEKDKLSEQLHKSTESNKMIKEELNSMIENFDDLKKHVECPICLEVPRKAPIFTCPNGHFLCQKCKCETCPTCRENMGDNKSILAVAVTEVIQHDCKFLECEEKFPLGQIEKHEKVCQHRIVSCPSFGCHEKAPLSKLLRHIRKNCSIRKKVTTVIGSSGQQTYQFDLNSTEIALSDFRVWWKLRTFEYNATHFVLSAQKYGDYFHFTIVMFESPEVCSDFYVELEVYEASSPPDKRLGAKLICNPCSINHTASKRREQGLSIHYKVMEKMALREDSFMFTVKFSFI